MKILKKLATCILALILIFQSAFVLSAASGSVSLEGPAKVFPGEQFEVNLVSTVSNTYGINADITFNAKAFKYVSASTSLGGSWKTEINQVDNKVYVAALDSKNKTTLKKSAEVLTVTFEAIEGYSGEDAVVKTSNVFTSVNNKSVKIDNDVYSPIWFVETYGGDLGDADDDSDDADDDSDDADDDSDDADDDSDDADDDSDDADDDSDEEDMLNNNLLEYLIVNNAEISPKFSPEIQKYTTTVPFTVKELEVEAKAISPTAIIDYIDTELIYVGTNIVRVRVTSESGLKRTYKIYVQRENKIKTNKEVTQNGFPVLWIVLIIIGALALIAAIIFIIIFVRKKRKKNS